MPNHITNVIELKEATQDRVNEILEVIKNDEVGLGSIDFNKLIPMPDHIFRGNLGQEERELYGRDNWYDFSVSHWGSKWNAYDFAPYNEGENIIEFHTAWSTVPQILHALSEKYPDVLFKHQWADEDFGFNLGEQEYNGGEVIGENIPAGGSKEAYEMAADIMGYELEDLGLHLSEDGLTYEYTKEDEVPDIEQGGMQM